MTHNPDPSKCDICMRRPTSGVYAVPFVPLSLGHCDTCLENSAFPAGLIKWVLGAASDEYERRMYFETTATVPEGSDYRKLTFEELDRMEAHGQALLEALRDQQQGGGQSRSR